MDRRAGASRRSRAGWRRRHVLPVVADAPLASEREQSNLDRRTAAAAVEGRRRAQRADGARAPTDRFREGLERAGVERRPRQSCRHRLDAAAESPADGSIHHSRELPSDDRGGGARSRECDRGGGRLGGDHHLRRVADSGSSAQRDGRLVVARHVRHRFRRRADGFVRSRGKRRRRTRRPWQTPVRRFRSSGSGTTCSRRCANPERGSTR